VNFLTAVSSIEVGCTGSTCRFSHLSFQFRDAAIRTFEFMRGFGMVGDKRPIYGDDSKSPFSFFGN
jgi:hypothetical protein